PPSQNINDDALTYLLTPRFRVTPDLMVYARLASGYRPGGFTSNSTIHALPTFRPDTTGNYEIGIKGNLLDRKLSFDASSYYIDWKDIQLTVFDPHYLTIYENAAGARSRGVELSVEAKPLMGLTAAAWVAWNDAVVTEAFPAANLAAGGRLSDSSPLSG